ncbi:MAG TPA: response regulator [Thermoanaerobaculia bacterium]|nr:response regulator [Thermoanaerobaculia bacterium]
MGPFEQLTSEASRVLGVPAAWIGFLTPHGEEIVAATGSKPRHMQADASFAMRIARATDLVVVRDTNGDARFSSHPLVVAPPHVRFYAGAPIFNAHGAFAGALSVLDRAPRDLSVEQAALLCSLAREATQELRHREQLSEANDRFRDFFEQTSDLVLSVGPDGALLHANEIAHAALGLTRGTPMIHAVEPDRRAEVREALTRVFESGQAERLETAFVTPGGNRITLEGWLRPKVIDGRTVLARVVFRDVTDRKQFEAELGNARDAALEAARAKTQFLSNVSHEIRTPMNGIVGMVDLLLATPLNAEQQDFAHQARASAEQLLSIVNNILYVSNLQAGSLASNQVDFDLFRTLQRIVEVMKVAALGKDLDVELVYDAALPAVFRGNQSKLRQVVTNLMENAIKFTESGRVVLTVGTQTETETHRVIRFEIRDTGIGMSDEQRLALFERFAQLDATSTRRFGGVGLGLATARHLVETMGGLIDVDSAPGNGATFWFTVPFANSALDRRPIASSDLELRGRRVLLVDRHPSSRKIARHYLESSWEMRVETADDAQTALAMLQREAARDPFRLTIVDSGDPAAFARQVRGIDAIAGTSLVALIAAGSIVNEEQLRDAGINAYTSKPVGQQELFDAIAIACAHEAIPLARTAVPQMSGEATRVLSAEERRKMRVLLVEDNFLNMKLTMSQLQKLGFEAASVGNGQEALDALSGDAYDVILMDCQMPILDGYQATAEIRRREQRGARRRHIIAMTANALEGDREKCLAAGMDDYLSKPTRHEELEKALSRYVVG